jgi:hypothetical protein
VAYQSNPTIDATEDVLAALSAIRESVIILAARRRDDLTNEDADELQRILDACDRLQNYHLIIRATEGLREKQLRTEKEKPPAR